MAYSAHNPNTDKHYIADAIADLAVIPSYSMGDTVYVIENGKTYTSNSKGEWICPEIASNSEGSAAAPEIDLSGYVKSEDLAETLAAYVSNEALVAMPFANIMRENGEHKIALGPTNDMMLVDKMDELGPGLYTMYMERSCQDIPAGAREIDSSCRGIFFVDTYKIAEQNSQHFYGWALLFDHAGNVYSKYVRRSIATEWQKLS